MHDRRFIVAVMRIFISRLPGIGLTPSDTLQAISPKKHIYFKIFASASF